MNTNEFIKQGPKVTSKAGAVDLIALFLSDMTVPTFGYEGEEGEKINPMEEGYGEDANKENEEIVRDYEIALKLAGVLAKKWDIPFHPELFASTMGNMRGHCGGLWNSSSIGC